MTSAEFVRFVKSHRARFRAGVARDPQERAAVAWNDVIADATGGITSDIVLTNASVSTGWAVEWPTQHYFSTSWHQMWQYMIGMADVSGAYSTWLATPDGDKEPFLVVTPDKRFPAGATRALQITNSPDALPVGQYFRNRPEGQDSPGHPLATSFYDHWRFRAYEKGSQSGPYPIMAKGEIDMLAAEGYIRTQQWPLAVALIDTYRTRNNLLPLGNITSLDTPVPGGAACVPKVPAPPTFKSAVCGNIMEAMKWEYRMETAYVGYGQWYFAGRGWGDLPAGTPIHFPVPYQERDATQQPFYNLGGVGRPGGAVGPTTYGL
jgi:hypothetical protein